MNWRTDKPTAKLIVAYVRRCNPFPIVLKFDTSQHKYYASGNFPYPFESIIKWADLEEDEGVDLPMWKKSNLPNADKCGAGVNSENLCYNGYYISYKELFQKLPKENERR